jgi:hypothetical protein
VIYERPTQTPPVDWLPTWDPLRQRGHQEQAKAIREGRVLRWPEQPRIPLATEVSHVR